MIGTVFKISVWRLWNNKQELLLIFAVPILFFSIFALIFSRGVGSQVDSVAVSIINDDPSPITQRIIHGLLERPELSRVTGIGNTTEDWPIERLSRTLISQLDAEVVIYFPPDFGEQLASAEPIGPRIYSEGTNPFSSQVAEASLSQSIAAQRPVAPAAMVRLAMRLMPRQARAPASPASTLTATERSTPMWMPKATGTPPKKR